MLSSFRKQDKKDEESGTSGNPYKNLEKASVLQEVNHPNELSPHQVHFFLRHERSMKHL
jgi:hypothetical protein